MMEEMSVAVQGGGSSLYLESYGYDTQGGQVSGFSYDESTNEYVFITLAGGSGINYGDSELIGWDYTNARFYAQKKVKYAYYARGASDTYGTLDTGQYLQAAKVTGMNVIFKPVD